MSTSRPACAAVGALLAVGLAACGGSSSTTDTNARAGAAPAQGTASTRAS